MDKWLFFSHVTTVLFINPTHCPGFFLFFHCTVESVSVLIWFTPKWKSTCFSCNICWRKFQFYRNEISQVSKQTIPLHSPAFDEWKDDPNILLLKNIYGTWQKNDFFFLFFFSTLWNKIIKLYQIESRKSEQKRARVHREFIEAFFRTLSHHIDYLLSFTGVCYSWVLSVSS